MQASTPRVSPYENVVAIMMPNTTPIAMPVSRP
ncbi:hypothetical protein BVI434_500040 [Burkholderia vietnamiensis]|nr:hypothetical protein BVI434_500040 [Burkholderia vietnamiensis]